MSRKEPTTSQIYFPDGPAQRDKLKADAAALDMSLSELMIKGAEEYVKKHRIQGGLK